MHPLIKLINQMTAESVDPKQIIAGKPAMTKMQSTAKPTGALR
jgi:hypothetical protein